MKKFLTLLDRLIGDQSGVGLLLLRIALGVVYVVHGAGKLIGDGIPKVAEGFAGMGIPLPLISASLATLTEFVGGLFILVGFLTRWTSIPCAFVMVVAIATVHGKNGFMAQAGGFEYNFVLGLGFLVLLFAGAGKYSVDAFYLRHK